MQAQGPTFLYKAQPLTDTRQRGDYVLGKIQGALWIGVRFGAEWRPARRAGVSDIRYFN